VPCDAKEGRLGFSVGCCRAVMMMLMSGRVGSWEVRNKTRGTRSPPPFHPRHADVHADACHHACGAMGKCRACSANAQRRLPRHEDTLCEDQSKAVAGGWSFERGRTGDASVHCICVCGRDLGLARCQRPCTGVEKATQAPSGPRTGTQRVEKKRRKLAKKKK